LQKLEHVVKRLEEDDLSLAKALVLFETGVRLVRHCTGQLDAAEKRIKVLLEQDDGKLGIADFGDSAKESVSNS